MNNIKKFSASSELFSGFQADIDVNYFGSNEEISEFFKNKLIKLFEDNKLEYLKDKARYANFHIHTHSFEEILISERNTIFYICDHC